MSKILVAYFSATGVTEKAAKKLSTVTGGDLFEIAPVVPYSAADLEWRNPNSRSSLEMKDKKSRPQVVSRVSDMADYDTIFVGFPIWWYVAPTIVNTFLEEYNLSDKTIIPFATSGSSGMENINESLAVSCPDSILKEGKRFSADADWQEYKDFVEKVCGDDI